MTTAGNALVTGASSGIGAAYAEQLAGRGYDFVLVARDAARLQASAVRLAAAWDRLTDDRDLRILLTCAGLGSMGPAVGGPADRYDGMVALTAAAGLAEWGGGTVMNVSSVVALVPERFNAAYAASKTYVFALAKGLAAEVAGRGVRFQAVLPGITRTDLFERAWTDLSRSSKAMIMEADDLLATALVSSTRARSSPSRRCRTRRTGRPLRPHGSHWPPPIAPDARGSVRHWAALKRPSLMPPAAARSQNGAHVKRRGTVPPIGGRLVNGQQDTRGDV